MKRGNKAAAKIKMGEIQVQHLVKIGLSRQEAEIYLLLLQKGPLSAKNIATYLNILPNAVYRGAQKLKRKGLVAMMDVSPVLFNALSPSLALVSYAKKQALLLEQGAKTFLESLHPRKASPTQIKVIFGKEPVYLASAKMVAECRREVLFISIGELIPAKLLLSIRRAVERGVKVKLIVHKYDETNREIIKHFEQNGMEVRHSPDWGFHLGVYDKKEVILVVNNPRETDERIGIVMASAGLAKAMRDYFYFTWRGAVEI